MCEHAFSELSLQFDLKDAFSLRLRLFQVLCLNHIIIHTPKHRNLAQLIH